MSAILACNYIGSRCSSRGSGVWCAANCRIGFLSSDYFEERMNLESELNLDFPQAKMIQVEGSEFNCFLFEWSRHFVAWLFDGLMA